MILGYTFYLTYKISTITGALNIILVLLIKKLNFLLYFIILLFNMFTFDVLNNNFSSLGELHYLLINPQFDLWNYNSIKLLIISAIGGNGLEFRNDAIKLFELFILHNNKLNSLVSPHDFTTYRQYFTTQHLTNILQRIKRFPCELINGEALRKSINKGRLLNYIYDYPLDSDINPVQLGKILECYDSDSDVVLSIDTDYESDREFSDLVPSNLIDDDTDDTFISSSSEYLDVNFLIDL